MTLAIRDDDRGRARLFLAEAAALVQRALAEHFDARTGTPVRLAAAMRHTLEAGGKRLRPALCLAAVEAVGGRRQDAMSAACALEMLHTYSLIHDDLPAMDDDDQRRGRPTCHVAFGEATAILAGDGLLTDAFGVLASCPGEPSRVLAAVRELAAAAGSEGMVGGQERDLEGTGVPAGVVQVERIHEDKTAALLRASVAIGAILGGGSGGTVEALRHYGTALGMAFQAMDDVLDATGRPEDLGKTPGKDEAHQAPTLVRVLGLDGARQRAATWADAALEALGPLPDGPATAVLRGFVDLAVARDR